LSPDGAWCRLAVVRLPPVMPRALLALALWALLGVPLSSRAAPGPAPAPALGHVVLVVMENKDYGRVLGSPDAPALNALVRRGAMLASYHAVAHPSLPNYLALVSGSTQGISTDCTSCVVSGPSLADSLEARGLTWKTYAEGLPRAGFTGAFAGRYAKKHDPFVYFASIRSDPRRLASIVPLGRFTRDLAGGTLPDFSLVVPDLCHDMHDCSVATGDAWLGRFLRPLLASPQLRDGAVMVVFDEGGSSEGGGGHVPALVLGPLVRPGVSSHAPVTHYGLLRTIEEAFGLPLLGQSASAVPIRGIWRPARTGRPAA
jgi:acid phosphatase